MQIVSLTDVKGNRSGDWNAQSGRSYQSQLRIITDDPTMGPRAIAKALSLRFGDYYQHPLTTTPTEWDYGSYVQSIGLKEEGDDGKQWLCSLTYGPFNWAEQGGATSEAASEGQTNPFNVPPKVSFGSAKFERDCAKDATNKPIVNNVGDPFDPPLKRDDSRPTLTIVRNEPSFDSQYVQTFKDTVNKGLFLETYLPNTVKCADVTAEREYQADWGYYWVVTYSFEIREFITDAANNVIVAGWFEIQPNVGLRELKTPFTPSAGLKPIRIQGEAVTKPVMIGQDGTYDPAFDPCYLQFQLYPLADFDKFNFPKDLLTVSSIPGGGGS